MAWWKRRPKHTIDVGACSDVGRVRSDNQDAFGVFQGPEDRDGERLFVVADGMGGHARGQEASSLAVEVIRETFYATRRSAVGERLRRAIEAANASVYEQTFEDPSQQKMGTTCTTMAVVDGYVHMAHVGDSRAYRIDEKGMEQLTRDHTLVEELRRQGVLTDEEARTHPRRHALTRAVGIEPKLDVDVLGAMPIRPPQTFLLCSDGLAPVTEEEIYEIVSAHPPQDACEHLIRLANDRGGPDNVTVLIVALR